MWPGAEAVFCCTLGGNRSHNAWCLFQDTAWSNRISHHLPDIWLSWSIESHPLHPQYQRLQFRSIFSTIIAPTRPVQHIYEAGNFGGLCNLLESYRGRSYGCRTLSTCSKFEHASRTPVEMGDGSKVSWDSDPETGGHSLHAEVEWWRGRCPNPTSN